MCCAPLAVAFIAAITSGCAHKWADLKRVEREQYFVLAKAYTRTETRGIGVKWVEGLRTGVYRLGAEDDDGLYFRGEGNCVVMLSGSDGDEYLKTGQSKLGFQAGGLWLPKKGVEKDPKLFYLLGGDVSTEQVTAASTATGQPTTVAGGVGAGLGGALVGGIIAAGKGDVLFINYGSEKDFVAGLKILDK